MPCRAHVEQDGPLLESIISFAAKASYASNTSISPQKDILTTSFEEVEMAHGFRSNLKFYSIAGVGLFGDGFMNITIGLVVPIIGYLYYANEGDTVPTVPADAIKGAYAIGMIIGQLAFGLFGDALGRHKVYGKSSSSRSWEPFCLSLLHLISPIQGSSLGWWYSES